MSIVLTKDNRDQIMHGHNDVTGFKKRNILREGEVKNIKLSGPQIGRRTNLPLEKATPRKKRPCYTTIQAKIVRGSSNIARPKPVDVKMVLIGLVNPRQGVDQVDSIPPYSPIFLFDNLGGSGIDSYLHKASTISY
jgi:hypothetical protein